MKINTERLMLRLMQAEDFHPLMKLWTDPDVTEFLGGPRVKESLSEGLNEDIENPEKYTYNLWPVFEKETSQIVGHCGFIDKEIEGKTEYDLCYIFFKETWGKGYATEISLALIEYAKNVFKLDRLVAVIEPENRGSRHVAEKVGMHLEKELVRPDNKTKLLYMMDL